MRIRRIIMSVLMAVAISVPVVACSDLDPHKCGPDDIDGDGDGRCNE